MKWKPEAAWSSDYYGYVKNSNRNLIIFVNIKSIIILMKHDSLFNQFFAIALDDSSN